MVTATVVAAARMAESADAEASKVFTREGVWVRVPLRARCYRCSMSSATPFQENAVALFPGQGSIASGAGLAWRESAHWGIIAKISEVANTDVATLLLDAPTEVIVRTDNAQIATFALSMIGYLDLLERGVRPRYHLGHSLGEFTSLVASGLISLEDGARLISVRGAAMARAATECEGSMVALLGGDDQARAALADLDGVWVANINGTEQIVVSGTTQGLQVLVEKAREFGWRRATALPVGGAFHSPLMAPAQEALDQALSRVQWGTTEVVHIANVDGRIHANSGDWSNLLSRQLTSPIEFVDATLALPPAVTTSIEMPPAGVLTGLTKRIREFPQQVALSSLTDLQELTL